MAFSLVATSENATFGVHSVNKNCFFYDLKNVYTIASVIGTETQLFFLAVLRQI